MTSASCTVFVSQTQACFAARPQSLVWSEMWRGNEKNRPHHRERYILTARGYRTTANKDKQIHALLLSNWPLTRPVAAGFTKGGNVPNLNPLPPGGKGSPLPALSPAGAGRVRGAFVGFELTTLGWKRAGGSRMLLWRGKGEGKIVEAHLNPEWPQQGGVLLFAEGKTKGGLRTPWTQTIKY